MSNIIESKDAPVVKHLERCLVQYEKGAAALLQSLRENALFGIAMEGRASMGDYETVREALDTFIRQRKATDAIAAQTIRRDLHLAYTRPLPAPPRPYHLRHKRYPRWAKE